MKLFRFGPQGKEQTGVVLRDRHLNVSSFGEDYGESFFQEGGLERLQDFVNKQEDVLPEIPKGVRMGAPFCRPSKIVCIGLNYADHARETHAAPPPEPILFFKSTTALCGPDDEIILPRNSVKTDWEVELAVVIGRKTSYINEEQAPASIAGYCVHNDLSERAFQLERNGQWVKGKSCDTFAPMGPYLVTPDEAGDIDHLRLWLKLNGRIVQDGNTSNLIFKVPFLISYISQFMTLLPGDVISTGTPAGVGLGMNPPVYLRSGDLIELGIDGLGSGHQLVRAYSQD
jgi:2,4-didehydro-3-deoxy-L-rhamnonate hydrolase